MHTLVESLFLQASSYKIAFALKEFRAVSAFVTPGRDFGGTSWSNGVPEYWIWRNQICFYMSGRRRDINVKHHPMLIFNTSLLHYAITP
jgi:hypothetical protein